MAFDKDRVRRAKQALTEPADLVASLGFKRAVRQHHGVLVECPSHADRTPSCSVTVANDRTIRVFCFSDCGLKGDALTLIAAVRGWDLKRDFKDVLEEAERIGNISSPPAIEWAKSSASPAPVVRLTSARFDAVVKSILHNWHIYHGATDVAEYVSKRGILAQAMKDDWAALPGSKEQRASWVRLLKNNFDASAIEGLVSGDDFRYPEHRLIIPWRDASGLVYTVQRRALDARKDKYRFPQGSGSLFPYGIERLRADGLALTLVEGAVDVLARRELQHIDSVEGHVIGLAGVSAWEGEFAKYGKDREVTIGLDADAAGEKAVKEISDAFYRAGAKKVFRSRPKCGSKDWAEALEKKVS